MRDEFNLPFSVTSTQNSWPTLTWWSQNQRRLLACFPTEMGRWQSGLTITVLSLIILDSTLCHTQSRKTHWPRNMGPRHTLLSREQWCRWAWSRFWRQLSFWLLWRWLLMTSSHRPSWALVSRGVSTAQIAWWQREGGKLWRCCSSHSWKLSSGLQVLPCL